jgi:transposase InsO family protein
MVYTFYCRNVMQQEGVKMTWKVKVVEAMRMEFVQLALQPGSNIRELCRRFDVSAPTGYKWLHRFRSLGQVGLSDMSRRPHTSPVKTDERFEDLILALREQHPVWGGRKLRRRLQDLGHQHIPSASTITEILRRHGQLSDPEEHPGPFQRFSRPEPNDLWQMDFKGEFRMSEGWCHPLTVLDDCSRFSLCVAACSNQRRPVVQDHLTTIFKRYGMPRTILADNAPPWGSGDPRCRYTGLGVWFLQLGIQVIHGRPYHPQTQGKDERFHKTLKAEVIARRDLFDLIMCQEAFDQWRPIYNHQRPHESLNMDVPSAHYRASPRNFPEKLTEPEYLDSDIVRTVKSKGEITFQNQFYYIGNAFAGHRIALRPTREDQIYEVFYGPTKIGRINRTLPTISKWKYMSIQDQHPPFCFYDQEEMC